MAEADSKRLVAERATDGRGVSNRLATQAPPPQVVAFDRGSTVWGHRPAANKASPHKAAAATSASKPVARSPAATPAPARKAAAAPKPLPKPEPKQAPAVTAPPKAGVASKAKAAAAKPQLDDATINGIADEVIRQYWIWQSTVFPTEKTAAKLILSMMRAPREAFDARALDRFLDVISRHPYPYIYFARLTRDEELAQFLLDRGMAWDRLSELDPPSPQDWLLIGSALVGGAAEASLENDLQTLMLPKDIGYALYVAVGRYWDPDLQKNYKEFTGALSELFHNPIVTGNAIYREKSERIKQLWARRQYEKAAFEIGRIVIGIVFALRDIKNLGKGAVAVARNLPRVTINTVRHLQLLPEFARFYLSTTTGGPLRAALKDGVVLQRLEDSIILVRPGAASVQLDLKALNPDEIKQWQGVLVEEQRVRSAVKEIDQAAGGPLNAAARAAGDEQRAISSAATSADEAAKDVAAAGKNARSAGTAAKGTRRPGVGKRATSPGKTLESGVPKRPKKPRRPKREIIAPSRSRAPEDLLSAKEIEQMDDLVNELESTSIISDPTKTVAIREGGGRPTLSGPGGNTSPADYIERARPDGKPSWQHYIDRYEELSGEPPSRFGRDTYAQRDHFATHAEVKDRIHQFDEGVNKGIAVSQDMCPHCRAWFQRTAQREAVDMVVADVHHTRHFRADGSVDIYRTGGEYLQTIPPGVKPYAKSLNYIGVPW